MLRIAGVAVPRHRAAAGHRRRPPSPAPRPRWWRQTVAQPLEAAVVGVDKMIYMKSNSANDGSYTLTVSFELGTNPDIDTVNVNNRVQQALARLPPEVQRRASRCASAPPPFWSSCSSTARAASRTRCSSATMSRSTCWTGWRATPGVGDATLFGRLDYSMRIWFDMNRLVQLNLAPADIIAVIQSQNVQAAVGRIGARPTATPRSSS